MRLQNYTQYRDDDLRWFFLAALRSMGSNGLYKTITVKYTRAGTWCGGRAGGNAQLGKWVPCSPGLNGGKVRKLLEGKRMTILLPKPGEPQNMPDIARTVMHEILHLRGAQHRDMTEAQRKCTGPLPEWAEGLELRFDEAPAEPSREEKIATVVAQREEHARAMLAKWEAKAKRATVIAKKWRTKVAGYERRAAAKKGGAAT